MSKTTYFKPEHFIDHVIQKMQMENTAELRQELAESLAERILAVILSNCEAREEKLFAKLETDHPELQKIDVVMMLIPSMPHLQKKLESSIEELYQELTFGF